MVRVNTGATSKTPRRLPVGADVVPGGTHFRVWAPTSQSASVLFENGAPAVRLEADGDGYFSGFANGVGAGALYRYEIASGRFPDPASRFQPDGPHGPSQVIDPTAF